MSDSLGRHLFDFAVLSDSHVNEADDRSVSPYRSNRLANARFRRVVREVDRAAPAFALHLGDMANPLPELLTYAPAVERFRAIAGELAPPLRFVAGNHCVGDKPGGWVPVPRVSERSLAQYRELWGPLYYSFDHGPCHFAALCSLLLNSGLREEDKQRQWLERDLDRAAAAGRRIFLAMHYPPFIATPDELGSYDNVDPPGRGWLLGLLERWPIEAVFSGHVHNYFYNRYADTPLYTVPATSFVRQDYAELYRVGPADREGGRNDPDKLGWGLVRVFERGHLLHVVRTGGRASAGDEELPPGERLAPVHPRARGPAPIGAEMRENWLARTALRPNNSVSPFTRRAARNDWPVLALEEMGVSRVRLALQELVKEDVLERMATLTRAGFEFLVYSHGAPGDAEYRLVSERRGLLAGWELLLDLDEIEAVARGVARLAAGAGEALPPCYLSQVRDVSRGEIDDANVRHVANYGFQPTEAERLAGLARREPVARTFRGFVFRIRRRGRPEISPWAAVREVARLGRESGMRHQVHILFSGNVTAERFLDDRYAANRVAEAALAALVAGNVDLWLDTFEDVDRGYFVRHGLVDRRYNPRLAARVLGHLQAALAGLDLAAGHDWEARRLPEGRVVLGLCGPRPVVLILPRRPLTVAELDLPRDPAALALALIDLDSGSVRRVTGRFADARLRLAEPAVVETPHLLLGPAG